MPEQLSPIIQPTDLLRIYNLEDLVIFDVSNGKDARSNYDKKHLDGARYIDLNTQLANIPDDFAKGGRHPLPDIREFSRMLGSLGISTKSHVILYDDKNGSNAAARFWWMLRSIGHDKVQVINGGLQEAEKSGIPVNSKTVTHVPVEKYEADKWLLPLADISEVENILQRESHVVIDVRAEERFNGESETVDLIAGHIPGAINIPFATNLDDHGLFHRPEELRTRYQKIFDKTKPENIVVHCGSGVTACHTLLAIAYAGLQVPKLYVGSWSEWSRNNKAIATKKNALD